MPLEVTFTHAFRNKLSATNVHTSHLPLTPSVHHTYSLFDLWPIQPQGTSIFVEVEQPNVAVNFPLFCKVTSAPRSQFGRWSLFVEVGLQQEGTPCIMLQFSDFLFQSFF